MVKRWTDIRPRSRFRGLIVVALLIFPGLLFVAMNWQWGGYVFFAVILAVDAVLWSLRCQRCGRLLLIQRFGWLPKRCRYCGAMT
jgi:hypothetical protein